MQMLRQVAGSFLLALCAFGLVIGGISLALAEVYVPDNPTHTLTQEAIPVLGSPTILAPVPILETPTPLLSATHTPPSSCLPPANWIQIAVQPGDDLANLAARYKTTTDELARVNCLFSNTLLTGSTVYVPPIPQPTAIPCGPPVGWVRYTVQAGNTMYSLSHAYGATISQIQFANCMPSYQYNLNAGQSIWLPYVAVTRTPLPTATATLTPVSMIFPTLTGTATVTPTATIILTSTATATPTATPTATATVASPTTPPTATATITAFPTDTAIPVP